jgi:nucleoside-diphosphate-sugar epimerase
MSTGSVHGQSPAPGTDESSPLHVHHVFAYNNAKVRAERKLRRLRARGTVEIVMLRPTIVLGPGSRWIFDFAYALRDGTAYVVDGGAGICNSIDVDNLGHAVHLALTASGVDGETFLVGDAETVTWADLYRTLANGLGFDWSSVANYSPPEVKPTFRQRYVEPFRTSEIGRMITAGVPRSAKTAVKTLIRAARGIRKGEVGAATSVGSPSSSGPPLIPLEIAALHRCQWRLPNDKAARLLGYSPVRSFDDGCRQSIEWMKPLLDVQREDAAS